MSADNCWFLRLLIEWLLWNLILSLLSRRLLLLELNNSLIWHLLISLIVKINFVEVLRFSLRNCNWVRLIKSWLFLTLLPTHTIVILHCISIWNDLINILLTMSLLHLSFGAFPMHSTSPSAITLPIESLTHLWSHLHTETIGIA
jgi:hypothetical protein